MGEEAPAKKANPNGYLLGRDAGDVLERRVRAKKLRQKSPKSYDSAARHKRQ
jgi:hypothetical protein